MWISLITKSTTTLWNKSNRHFLYNVGGKFTHFYLWPKPITGHLDLCFTPRHSGFFGSKLYILFCNFSGRGDPDLVQDLGEDHVLVKDRSTVAVDVQDQEIEDDHGQEIDADQDHEKEEDDQEQDLEIEEEIAADPDHEIGM